VVAAGQPASGPAAPAAHLVVGALGDEHPLLRLARGRMATAKLSGMAADHLALLAQRLGIITQGA
jgi:hypothetical protein